MPLLSVVSTVATFSTEGEAVDMANDSEFGLAGAVISADEARCKRVAEALQVGPGADTAFDAGQVLGICRAQCMLLCWQLRLLAVV